MTPACESYPQRQSVECLPRLQPTGSSTLPRKGEVRLRRPSPSDRKARPNIENKNKRQSEQRPMTADRNPTNPFNRFMTAYPEREGGHDLETSYREWTRAIERADIETIIAGAIRYRMATAGRPARYIMSARRWLAEMHWCDSTPVSGSPCAAMVWISYGSKEWAAWAEHYRATRGKTPPQDRRGGWRFPSRIPPAIGTGSHP